MRLFKKESKIKVFYIKPFALILIFFAIGIINIFLYNTCYNSLIKEKAKIKANYVTQNAIQAAIREHLSAAKYDYNEFTKIEIKNDNSIASLSVNTVLLNNIKAEITDEILNKITEFGKMEIEISPLAFRGYRSFDWIPKIPITVVPAEILTSDFKSSFKAEGINQTKHSISLSLKVKVELLLPVGSESFEIESTVPFAETIIVGEVPETYTNVEGVKEITSETILELAS